MIYQNILYEYCFDIKYIISLIDRDFFKQIIKKEGFRIDIKKKISIKVRELRIKKHDICEYIVVSIYIFNINNKMTLICREIYIVNNLFIKALININIIKFEIIIFDINKNFVIINFCDFF